MNAKKASSQPVTAERLRALREATEKVSEYLCTQTETYLNALRPALIPHRLLGQYIEHPAKRTVSAADGAWNRLTAAYRKVATKPYPIPKELDAPLKPIRPEIVLYPWEYRHEVNTGKERESITVVCPAKWIISYPSGFTASQFRHAVESDPARDKRRVQEFVIHALVMDELLRSVPGIHELFRALRLVLGEEKTPETGELSFATLTSEVESHLPSDDIVLQTTRLAGIPRFTELIDRDSVVNLADPLREQLLNLIGSKQTK